MTTEPDPEFTGLISTSGVSAFTGEPFVLLQWRGPLTGQMAPDEARQMALHIIAAADGAETDACLAAALTDAGVTLDATTALLSAVRDRRGQE